MPTIIIVNSQSFSRPVDWDDNNNAIYCIGGGCGGRSYVNGPHGGGGGAFAKSVNVVIPSTVNVVIGDGGTPDNVGGNTSFGGLVVAVGGNVISGGAAGSCAYNNVAYSGGNGGTWTGGSLTGGCGGGGAAGPTGPGGGGGTDNGYLGGNGGNSPSVVGGVGGNYTVSGPGANGNNGTDFGSSYGSGSAGGGGGANPTGTGIGFNGGHGGFYGGGGGGGGSGRGGTGHGSGGYGRSGIVVITYTPLVPIINSVVPAVGSTVGGTPVTINGVGFIGVSSVTFGGANATSVNVISSNTITCVTPAHVQGLVSVVVTGTNGVGSANAYRYVTYVFPVAGNLSLSGFSVTVVFEVDTTGHLHLSSSSPNIVNTTFRNITPNPGTLSFSSVRPSIKQTHDLVLSSVPPHLDVTTISVSKIIYDDDSEDDVIIIYLDEVEN